MEAEEIHKRIRTEKRLAEDNEIRRVMAQLADRIRDVVSFQEYSSGDNDFETER